MLARAHGWRREKEGVEREREKNWKDKKKKKKLPLNSENNELENDFRNLTLECLREKKSKMKFEKEGGGEKAGQLSSTARGKEKIESGRGLDAL